RWLRALGHPACGGQKSGPPWRWPYYPCSLFVYLTIGLAIRSWWLTIAFEPAKGTDTYFRPYFLLPLVLAWAVLILEMGLVRRSSGAIAAALLLPLVGLVIGFPGPGRNLVYAAFLERLVHAVGSPPQLVVAGLLLIYGYAWIRAVKPAEGFTLATGLLASVVGPQTLDWSSLSAPNPLVVAAIAGILFGMAVQRQSSLRALTAAALVAAGLCVAEARYGGDVLRFWQWHAPPLAMFAIVATFDDELAKGLRELSWRIAPTMALIGAIFYPWTMPELIPAVIAIYLALLLFASAVFWRRERRVELLGATAGTLAANLLAQARQLYVLLQQTALAGGLPWLAGGLLVVAFAFAISLLKMGLWVQTRRWLARVNLALGGNNGGTS